MIDEFSVLSLPLCRANNLTYCLFRELSRVGNNFINTKRIVCTKGKYPQALLEKWDEFADRKDSENDRPGVSMVLSNCKGWRILLPS